MTIAELQAMLPRRERRLIPGAAEMRATDAGPRIRMRIPFGRRSHDMGFVEIIDPGAFAKTLQEAGSDVVALWNHDPLWVLGRESNKTLELRTTAEALEGETQLDGEDQFHQHFARRIQRRDVIGASFSFEKVRDRWEEDHEDHTITRTLLEVRLHDVSPVTFPAYPDSEAEARALAEQRARELAAVRGIDPTELLAVLGAARTGKVEAKHIPSVRHWIGALEGLLPAEAPPAPTAAPASVGTFDLRQRRLAMVARQHGLPAAS